MSEGPLETLSRIMGNVKFNQDGCWLSTFAPRPDGYCPIKIDGKTFPVHRVAYELIEGQIPFGLVLDHLCRRRHCCNPRHLEPVTPRENVLRGIGLCAINARKTHCPRGHPLIAGNLATHPSNGRVCLTCKREREHLRREQFPELVREQQRRFQARSRQRKKERAVG